MTDKLPPQLLALFQARPPLRYIPPQDDSPESRGLKRSQLSGLGAFIPQLEDYKDEDKYEPTESWLQKKLRTDYEKKMKFQEMQKEDYEGFDPESDAKIKGDALKTLFVGRLSYDVKEGDLEREFGRFGPIERIRIVRDETEKDPRKQNRGYAFVVFDRERDMKGILFSLPSKTVFTPRQAFETNSRPFFLLQSRSKKWTACVSRIERS